MRPSLCHLPIDYHRQSDKEHWCPRTRLAVERILEREPDATTEKVAEDFGIGEQAATDQIKAVRFLRSYKAEKR
jgi:hypothetical protein